MAADGVTNEGGIPFLPKWFTAKVSAVADPGTPVKDYSGSYTFDCAALKLTFNGFRYVCVECRVLNVEIY